MGVTDLKRTLRNLSALMNDSMREEEAAMQASAQSSMGKLLRLGGPNSISEKTYETPQGDRIDPMITHPLITPSHNTPSHNIPSYNIPS